MGFSVGDRVTCLGSTGTVKHLGVFIELAEPTAGGVPGFWANEDMVTAAPKVIRYLIPENLVKAAEVVLQGILSEDFYEIDDDDLQALLDVLRNRGMSAG